jgi:hypothetical protein
MTTMNKALVILISILVVALIYGTYQEALHPPVHKHAFDASASYSEQLETDIGREAVAAVYLKQVARDPDSVVIESTSVLEHRTIHGKEVLIFSVHYRAKNGFGGYNRNVCWVVSDILPGNVRILDMKP